MEKGTFIPDEFFKIKELNYAECIVLAKYKYYTENGKYKCCSLTCEQIADELNMSVDYLKKIKKHLKELGFIRCDGIKVIYLGIKECTIVHSDDDERVYYSTPKSVLQYPQECTIVHSDDDERVYYSTPKSVLQYPGGVLQYPQECTIVPEKVYSSTPIKKEIKKENKKEKKWVTNIKLLFANLPKDYQTKERVSYIKDNYMDKLNEVDLNEGGILDTWVVNIKNVLNKVYPQDFIIEKEEPRNNTIDVL